MQVKTTIGVFGFVLSLVLCARAGAIVSSSDFTTGTSVENLTNGVFDASLDDFGGESGSNYWASAGTLNAAVTNYTPTSPAYDYEAKGTTRNALFDDEPVKPAQGRETGKNYQYLSLDTDGTLYRNIFPANVSTNVFVKDYPNVYADTLVAFSVSVSSPVVGGAGTPTCDKVVVWLREAEDAAGQVTTNLVVTAGRYAGDFGTVTAHDYVTTNEVAAGAWTRLTIRAIGDVTDKGIGQKAPGYAIYLDGKPVVADESYDIGLETISSVRQLSSESRVLAQERRLFPSLARAGLDESATLTRFAFDGRGAVDDTSLSSVAPDFATPGNAFTLQWDAGVTGMKCIVSNELAVVTNTIDATVAPFLRDFALVPDVETSVIVTDVVYDAAHEFKQGQWSAKDCELVDNVFICDGNTANPMGTVASTRDIIVVGGGQYDTFTAAKLAATGDVKTIVLGADIDASAGTLLIGRDKSGKLDDLILDLNGHTLRGPAKKEASVSQTDGKLQIIDSSEAKTGRVLPPEGKTISVESVSSQNNPTLVLEAGAYDGFVSITGKVYTAYTGTCIVDGGSYTNVLGGTGAFYLEQYVTNGATYFTLDAQDYWSVGATGAYIWTGKGEDTWWTTADNWGCQEVPGEGDTVIFPRRSSGAWAVHFNVQPLAKDLWMDADIAMTGTNDFTAVKVVSGEGRFVGTGTAVFTGKIPGRLTDSARANEEMRLGASWAGTVKIAGVTRATPLTSIMYWGTARSKVEFNGVRGYVSDRASYALPYGLVLTDSGETPAWLNETGYTGSTISFPTLEGAGTFVSPLNTREILQVFQFKDVKNFTGGFNLGGKRLVLGEARALVTAKAGSFTFAEGVYVRSALDWTGVNAHFGNTLEVYGEMHDKLMAYTGTDVPVVSNVVVTLRDRGTGEVTTQYLSAKKNPGYITIITREEWEEEHGGGGGEIPEFAIDIAVASGEGPAVITVSETGVAWYGIQRVTSLAEDWDVSKAGDWKHADKKGDPVSFTVQTTGAPVSFFRVFAVRQKP